MDDWCVGFAIRRREVFSPKFYFSPVSQKQILANLSREKKEFLSGLFTAGQSIEWPNEGVSAMGLCGELDGKLVRVERVMTAVQELRCGDVLQELDTFSTPTT